MDLDLAVAAHLADARRAWPTLEIAAAVYAACLRETIAARADEPADRVLATMPIDLVLAAACGTGDAAAIALARAELAPDLRHALARTGARRRDDRRGRAARVDHAVRRRWRADPPVQRPRPAAQLGSQHRRAHDPAHAREIRPDRRPTTSYRSSRRRCAIRSSRSMRARYAPQVRSSFAQAMAALTPRQRNVLRQYHIDGSTIDQLAVLYKINRATAARWVAGARLALVTATRDRLIAELVLEPHEVDSVIRLVRSQLSLSVRELA